jgi:hypothetical protein
MRLTPLVLGPESLGAVVAGASELPPPVPALVVVFELEPHATTASAINTADAAIPAPREERVDSFDAAAGVCLAAVA